MIGEFYKTLCQEEAGFIVLPMGDGSYFVGECIPYQIEARHGGENTHDECGHNVAFVPSPPEVMATVRCVGQLVVTDQKPVLTNDASILDLMRAANAKMKKREANQG